jgi:hypothetical protein
MSHPDHSGNTSNPNPDMSDEQVLVDSFQVLVRYALRTLKRDAEEYGVSPRNFSVGAMKESLAASSNLGFSEKGGIGSLRSLVESGGDEGFTFYFYWKALAADRLLQAAFRLLYQPDGDLEVRLLALRLPDQVPIARSVGIVDGRKPFEEAVYERLRFLGDGRLAPYPPPE